MTDQAQVTPAPEAAPSPDAQPAPVPADNASDNVTKEETAPLSTQPKAKEEQKPATAADSVKAAREKIEKREAERDRRADKKGEADQPTETKPGDKPQEPDPTKALHHEPPARFNAAEKAEWEKVPEAAKQGVHRAITELQKGLESYKADATEMGELKEYRDLAKQYGVTLKEAMSNYVSLEMALKGQDPHSRVAAIEEVLRIAKVTPQQYAAYVTGRPVEEQAERADRSTMELRDGLTNVTRQLQAIAERQAEADDRTAMQQLNDWAADKPQAIHLADKIAAHVHAGLSLDDAYANAVSEAQEMAMALGFIPAAQATTNGAALSAHTPKVDKSIAGAPGAGSYPATKQPSKSVAEAVRRATSHLN
jgi:hypothetical protein